MKLTEATSKLFEELARDAGNWNGTPLVNGNVEVGTKTRGNLSDLVKKGLVTVQTIDGDEWVFFTITGKELVFNMFGVTIDE
jgi:hypothetical protein